MKTSFTILTLYIALSLFSRTFAQQAPEITIPTFDDPFCNTIRKLESGDTDIDYRAFRESFLESAQFKVASQQHSEMVDLKKEMYQYMGKSDWSNIIAKAKGILSIDYTDMMAHKVLQQTYKHLGDTALYQKYHDIEFGLLNSIVKNGNGRTCETGWPVVQIEEEYFILQMLGAELRSQSLDNKGGLCDRMEVKEDGKKKTYYFDVTKVFEGHKKLLD